MTHTIIIGGWNKVECNCDRPHSRLQPKDDYYDDYVTFGSASHGESRSWKEGEDRYFKDREDAKL